MQKSLLLLFIIGILFAFNSIVYADAISTFDVDSEGWSAYNGSCDVSWNSTDQSILVGDINNDWAWVTASSQFYGQWDQDGSLSADFNFVGSEIPLLYPIVFLIGNSSTQYEYKFSTLLSVNSWQTFSVSMNDVEWTATSGNDSLASVLNDITEFRIRVDFNDSITINTDSVKIDNILAPVAEGEKPVPEPATMLLFALGLLGVAGVSRKKAA